MADTAQSTPVNYPKSNTKNGFSFTFIIPYQHKMDRLMNLKRVVEWVSAFQGVEIILVEQDRVPRIKNIFLKNTQYYFVKSELPFNKALAMNVGLKHAHSPVIVFGDADIIMDPQQFINGLSLINQYECVSPYNKVIDLEANEVNGGLEYWKTINRPGRGETDIQKICLAGGIIMFRKDAALKIGGASQEFLGWGAEDDHLSFKIKGLLSWYEAPGTCYHLYHSKVVPDMTYYQRNLQLLNKLVQMNRDELIRYVAGTSNKIGMLNYYDR